MENRDQKMLPTGGYHSIEKEITGALFLCFDQENL
jgi:hypothetical protein